MSHPCGTFAGRRAVGWLAGLAGAVLAAACAFSLPVFAAPPERSSEKAASGLVGTLLEKAQIMRGLCAAVGISEAELPVTIARQSRLLVHALGADDASVDAARKAADAAGLYGTRIFIEKGKRGMLPYADNTIDLVILAVRDAAPREEVLRVLRPNGKAVSLDSPETVLVKPALAGTDNWSHWQHGPDNNPLSADTAIKAPYLTQWTGEPYYIAMPAITVAAGGRTFCAMGHIAHHEREEPWLNTLLARNGYNGIELWRMKLPAGYMVHRSAFIATDNAFYMINPDGGGCQILDPETGRLLGDIRIPELRGEWKWIALQDGILYILAGDPDLRETKRARNERSHWSWQDLSNGYYRREIPWGFGRTIAAYDVESKRLLWTHEEKGLVDSRGMVMGDGKIFFYGPYSHTGCLYAQTGHLLWTNDDPRVRELVQEEGRGLTSTPGFRTEPFSLFTPKAICYAPQTNQHVVAISTEDGRLLWHRKKTTSNPNLLYADGNILVGVGDKGMTVALDPETGEEKASLGFWKRSCARLTGTPDSFFCRGQPEGTTRYDRATGNIIFNGAMRPSCNDGVIPANGLLYIGPWLCDCNLSLMGAMAFCSAGNFRFDHRATEAENLERGPGNIKNIAPLKTRSSDWTAYRGGSAHNAASPVPIAAKVAKKWETTPQRSVTPTAPIAAGGLVFLAGDDGRVRALSADTGKVQWTFYTAGPVRVPPTIWNHRAYFGSGDGFVYCVEAATGRLLWRFRAAPVERRIMVYGRLCSSWPVNTGVVVEDGVAYVGAGLIDTDGTYIYALDAVTGAIKWQNNTSGHLNKEIRKGISAHGRLAVAGGKLWMAGGNVVSPAIYDLQTGECLVRTTVEGPPQSNRGEEMSVLNDKYVLLGGRLMFSAYENVVDPGYFQTIEIEPPHRSGLLVNGKIPPAWDDRSLVYVNGRRSPIRCADLGEIEHVFGKQREIEPQMQKRWTANIPGIVDVVGLALAQNAVVALCEAEGAVEPAKPAEKRLTDAAPGAGIQRSLRERTAAERAAGGPVRPAAAAVERKVPRWEVVGLDRNNGRPLWREALPSRPLSGALAIDGEGRIIVVLDNGQALCFDEADRVQPSPQN
ncbi:MAG: PQQ-binding-like beta-propeller repeat protein [Candidatus Sumerlaeia bacterium]|nr:PQQ-binding-like beta-propeller repeat protein [Candidatus Sumerlaeia bacterium]